MNNFMGKNGFIWWVGVVENRFDPLYLGRVQVRILGWHTRNKAEQPTSTLPWAYVMQPITSAAQTQVGTTPLGLVEGSWVMGFYRDGLDAQEPTVMGSIGGIPEAEAAFYEGFHDPRGYAEYNPYDIDNANNIVPARAERQNYPRDPLRIQVFADGSGSEIVEQEDKSNYPDTRFLNEPTTNRLARGRADATSKVVNDPEFRFVGDTIVQQKIDNRTNGQVGILRAKGGPNSSKATFDEPITPYDALYPYNHVHQTESGHIIEMDDTPGKERLHWYHRAGTFREIHPNGTIVDKSVQDQYNIVLRNAFEHVENTKVTTIDKGYELYVNADAESGQDFYIKVGGVGSLYGESESGKVEFNARNNNFIARGVNIELVALQDLILTAPTVTYNVGEYITTSRGNINETIDGNRTIAAGSLTLSSFGATSISPQTLTISATRSIEEAIQIAPSIPMAGTAKSVTSGYGTLEFTSRNYVGLLGPSGGIKLAVELDVAPPIFGISMSEFDMDSSGNIELSVLPTSAQGDITIDTKGLTGGIAMAALVGDITTTAAAGNITTLAAAGDITTQALIGTINLQTIPGAINIKSEIGFIEMTTGSTIYEEGKLGVIIEGLRIALGKKAKEPVIKGATYMKHYLKHRHLTGTGPSGPVMNALPYMSTLSRKVFTE